MSRPLAVAAVLALGLLALVPAPAEAQPCIHQGQQVQCPPGLPPGSTSVEFVPGGTNWRNSQTGAIVFVPSTTFPPFVATPTPPGPTTQPGPTVSGAAGDTRTQVALTRPDADGVSSGLGWVLFLKLFFAGVGIDLERFVFDPGVKPTPADQADADRGVKPTPVDQADAEQAPAVFTEGGAPVDQVM